MPSFPLVFRFASAALLLSIAAHQSITWLTRPTDDTSVRQAHLCRTWSTVLLMALGSLAAFSLSLEMGTLLVGGAYLILRFTKGFFEQRWGGLPGWGASATAALMLAFTAASIFLLGRLVVK